MDFTPLYPHSSSASSRLSPDGIYVLTSVTDRLVVRLSQSMQVIRSWKCFEQDNTNTQSDSSKSTQAQSQHPTSINKNLKSFQSARPPDLATTPLLQDPHRPSPVLTNVSFSPNSQYVCALLRRPTTSIVLIYSVELDQLAAQIQIGAEGVATGEKAVRWSPSGDSVMVWSDWNLRITIWPLSVAQSKPVQLHPPKHGPQFGSSFSSTHRYFALLCRQSGNLQDLVGIYDTFNWSCVSSFGVSTELKDPTHLLWSPCNRYLAIVESALLDHRVEIWSPSGSKLASFTPRYQRSVDPFKLSSTQKHRAPQPLARIDSDSVTKDHPQRKASSQVNELDSHLDGHVGLGIRHIKWRPDGEYLAVGGWDNKLRLLNDLTWTSICEIDFAEIPNARVLNEPQDWIGRTRAHGIVPFQVVSTHVLPEPLKPDYSKPNPAIGVKEIEWSANGEYMACRIGTMPTSIFIFSFRSSTHVSTTTSSVESGAQQPHCMIPLRPRLMSILNFTLPVKSLVWHPKIQQLVVVCATSAVYSWYPNQPGLSTSNDPQTHQVDDYCEGIGVPAGISFNPVAISWTPAGDMMLVSDKLAFCLAFPALDDVEQPQ